MSEAASRRQWPSKHLLDNARRIQELREKFEKRDKQKANKKHDESKIFNREIR